MNIKLKHKKQIVAIIAGVLASVSLVGCNNTTEGKTGEGKLVAKELNTKSNEQESLSVEEASRILYEKLGDTELWWTFADEWEDYYTFEETSTGADFRYLVNRYTGEVFFESATAIGTLIPFDEVDSADIETGPKATKLVKDLSSRVKEKDSLNKAKAQLSSKVQELLKKYQFEITDATELNDFVISDSTYNKYTEEYKQLMYYLFNEDFSNGVADLNIYLSQEIHSDYKLNKDDNFVKLLYDMYVYITSSDISIDEFSNILQKNHEVGGEASELTENYLGLSIQNELVDGKRRKLTMNLSVEIEGMVKSKYYKNEYDTVAEYKEVSEKTKNEIKSINDKYSNILSNATKLKGGHINEHYILRTSYNYGKSQFMQTGEITIAPQSENGLFTQEEVDRLNNILRLALGDSVYGKIDKSLLTVENLNTVFKSNDIKIKYDETIQNANKEISDEQVWYTNMEMNNASIFTYYEGVSIKFSVPVIAEGIRGV